MDTDLDNAISISESLFLPPRCSTPVSESSIEGSDHENYDRLFDCCNLSVSNFLSQFLAIASKHSASDAHYKDLLRLFQQVLPEGNKCPGLKQLKKQFKKLVEDNTHPSFPSKAGEVLLFKFTNELLAIIEKNFASLIKYNESKMNNSAVVDMPIPPFFDPQNPFSLSISLLISNDGVSFVKSTSQSLWPLWCAVVDLPPKLRYSFENITLCSLWLGSGKLTNKKFLPAFSIEFIRVIVWRMGDQHSNRKGLWFWLVETQPMRLLQA